jgi:hypothetical protein
MLTAKQILEQGIVIPSEYSKPAQVGIDLSLASVHRCSMGSVVFQDRTHIDPVGFQEVGTQLVDHKECWVLDSGTYAITLTKDVRFLLTQQHLSFTEAVFTEQEHQLYLRSGTQAFRLRRWVQL